MFSSFLSRQRIAYFSMEIGVRADIPTYSGGLGILAGDILRSAADLDLPMVGVTLIARRGYFRQILSAQGVQHEEPDPWNPSDSCAPLDAKVSVSIEGREVWIRAWLHVMEGHTGDRLPVIFLDTDLPENAAADRELTHHLYGGDSEYRFKQEVVLGIGGVHIPARP